MDASIIDSAFLNDPYPTYRALRAAGPLHWGKEFCGGAWLLTNYTDVANVLRDPGFSAQRASRWVNGSGPEARAELREFKRILSGSVVFLEGSRHSRLRHVMHETTRNLLGNGLFTLLKDRKHWQILKNNPGSMQSAIKELLRFESPVQYTGRRVMADIELHGHRLKKGELVIPLIGAANRDPSKFRNPDTIDLIRSQGSHLSFGYGSHACIGATLTCMEVEVAFNSLMRRLPNLELVSATPKWGSNAVYRGLITLPIRAY